MGDIFSSSGEKTDNVVVPTPRLRGLFLPGIDNPLAIDGFGTVIPWGGGNIARRYSEYGISTDISNQTTQLRDLASSLIPAEGGGITYNFEGLIGPQGPQGPPGPPGIIGITSLPSGYVLPTNSNFLSALPHNIDQINALGTALDKIVYTTSYDSYFGDYTLTERRPAGDADWDWYGVASDSDGSHLIAGMDTGRLYTSDDSGVSWTERKPAGDDDFVWYGVASDSDGSHLIAAVYGGRLYTSANYGVNWTERQPAGDISLDWDTVASDSDGSHLIAAVDVGRLYTSADSGATWTERQPAGVANKVWISVASDSDGSNLIAAVQGGRLYTSNNYGATWTERQPAGDSDINWASVASDSDGSHLIAGILTGRLYTSSDYGATWTERQPAGDTNQDWWGVASDSDGSNLIVAARTGRIYISNDYGVNWDAASGPGDWYLVASDSDGSNLIAGIATGRLYTGVGDVLYSEAIWAESDLTSAGRTILADATAADQATTLGLGTGDSPEFTGLTLSGLTSSRLVASGSALASVSDLTAWVAGVANEIDVANDGDGTITIGIVNPLIVGKGGTGATTLTDHSILLGSGTAAISALGAATNGQLPIGSTGADPVLAGITGTENQITVTNAAGSITLSTPQDIHSGASPEFNQVTLGIDPVNVDHSVTKSYADALVAGAFWEDVTVGTVANVNLATDLEAGDTIDDYVLVENDRVLVREQTDQTQNGLYTVPASGAASRSTDANTAGEIEGKKCIPLNGSLTKHRFYFCITGNITLGVTDIKFAEVTMMTAHNTLSGLQGGQVDQYYHLTLAKHNAVTSLVGLTYAADSFIKVTAEDTYAIRTIAETKTDLSLNNVENTAHSTDAHTMTIDGRDVSVDGTKLDGIEALADVTATNETSHADVVVDGDFVSNGILNRTGAGAYSILAIGTDVQAYHANLAAIAGGTWTGAASITTLGTIATGTWQSTDVGISYGGTGQSTAQAAIDALTQVSGATNEHVLTKDTASGNAIFKAATGGGTGFGRPIVLTPQCGMPPAASFATFDTIAGGSTPAEAITVLDFDASSSEYMDFKFALPAGYESGGLTVSIIFSMTSDHDEGTPHKVRWEVGFARISDDDLDMNGDQAYDYNGVSAIVPSVVGEVSYDDITFTDGADMDSLAAGEMAILRIYRDHDHADDNATGDAELQMIMIKET